MEAEVKTESGTAVKLGITTEQVAAVYRRLDCVRAELNARNFPVNKEDFQEYAAHILAAIPVPDPHPLADLAARQKPLDPEMARTLHENAWDLLEDVGPIATLTALAEKYELPKPKGKRSWDDEGAELGVFWRDPARKMYATVEYEADGWHIWCVALKGLVQCGLWCADEAPPPLLLKAVKGLP